MKKMITFALFLFSVLSSFAQRDTATNDIMTTKKFRKGIFQKYEEFKMNTPSITDGYIFKKDSGNLERYRLFFDEGKKGTDVYAFSNGTDLFINAIVYSEHANYFERIMMRGKLMYFEDQQDKKRSARNFVGKNPVREELISEIVKSSIGSIHPGWVIYLMDEDGQAWLLDRKSLLSIFKDGNIDLYRKLKADPKKDDFETLLNYVCDFNEQPLSDNTEKK